MHLSDMLIASLKQLNLPQLAVRHDPEYRYKNNMIIIYATNSLRDRVNIFKPALNLLQYNPLGAFMVLRSRTPQSPVSRLT